MALATLVSRLRFTGFRRSISFGVAGMRNGAIPTEHHPEAGPDQTIGTRRFLLTRVRATNKHGLVHECVYEYIFGQSRRYWSRNLAGLRVCPIRPREGGGSLLRPGR